MKTSSAMTGARKSQDAPNSSFCWEESGGLKGNLIFSFYDLVLFNDALKLHQISFRRPVLYVPSTWVTLNYCMVSQGILMKYEQKFRELQLNFSFIHSLVSLFIRSSTNELSTSNMYVTGLPGIQWLDFHSLQEKHKLQ